MKNKKPKIAYLVNSFPSVTETFIINQITGMLDYGCEVDIYSSGKCKHTALHESVNKYNLMDKVKYTPQIPDNYLHRFIKAIWLFVVNFFHNPIIILNTINIFRFGKYAITFKLLYHSIPFLREDKYDIVHCQYGTVGVRALKLRQLGLLQGKLVVSFRGYDVRGNGMNVGDYYYDLFNEADLILPVSKDIYNWLYEQKCEPQKIYILRSGINIDYFKFSPNKYKREDKIRVITVGHLAEPKGVEYSIRAMNELIMSRKVSEYIIVGDGPLYNKLNKIAQELGVGKHVKFVGWQNQQAVYKWLSQSHVLVAPNVTACNGEQAGIPNVIKEAMAIGIPVVSTYHAGIPELIENGRSGFLVPERNIEKLNEQLNALIDNPVLCSNIVCYARKKVENEYCMKKLNNKLIELYNKLLLKDEMLV